MLIQECKLLAWRNLNSRTFYCHPEIIYFNPYVPSLGGVLPTKAIFRLKLCQSSNITSWVFFSWHYTNTHLCFYSLQQGQYLWAKPFKTGKGQVAVTSPPPLISLPPCCNQTKEDSQKTRIHERHMGVMLYSWKYWVNSKLPKQSIFIVTAAGILPFSNNPISSNNVGHRGKLH